MQVSTLRWQPDRGWSAPSAPLPADPQLLLVFYADSVETSPELAEIRARFPSALVFGCSTAGEIADTRISDDGIVATAVRFEHTTIQSVIRPLDSVPDSRALGRTLAMSLPHKGLVHTIVLSDGLLVNGSELVRGLREALPPNVTATGGLSGDGARFARTTILCGGAPVSGQVAIVGLYGDKLNVGYGSQGGWDPFGPERVVTRSKANVLYELDGQPALALYKRYLGDYAKDLPSSALLFPLSLKLDDGSEVVRSILGVDEATDSMTFAGDVLEGQQVRLMMANFDRLVDGAVGAARNTQSDAAVPASPTLALLVSCVGRKIVLSQRAEDELEAVRTTLGAAPEMVGFYSYGEISPFSA
ncbi:MAG: FIST C-terminal domain-containing protein, partial [Candidatus Eisenbacteria bacterium]|nr:FIST C-terminal domain-containing protein [Candidatus Eisenbacteria bacterium]